MASYYVLFEDDTETVICAPNEQDAREISSDFNRNSGKIVDIHEVADQ